jgi:hypothetical protein
MVVRHCMREEAALDFKAAKFVSGRNAGHCGSLWVGSSVTRGMNASELGT